MRMHPLCRALTLAFPLTLSALAAVQAQTADAQAAAAADEHNSKSLGIVVVTGMQPTSLPTQIPTTIVGVTAADVEATVNATDSEDALKYFPSLLVRKRYIGDYNHAVLSTRASGTGNSARSLVFADGIQLSNLLGNGAAFTPRWGLVTPEEIERVDVLYGPFSAGYAGNSVGAVVDYVTRMPKAFEAHVKLGLTSQPFELYNTHETYGATQASASIGDRAGDLAWWVNVNHLDSKGQPLGFVTKVASTGAAVGATTPAVDGAWSEVDKTKAPWYILGTTTQYHTIQDHAKLKLAYDLGGSVRASYVLGYWHNKSENQSASYLSDASGNAVYSGNVAIGGKQYTIAASDFTQTREQMEHLMHGLSVKSRTRGFFDWELAASVYDYQRDLVRAPGVAKPAADAGGNGRVTDMNGTGWNTLTAKAIIRPGADHVIDAGVQQESYALRTVVNSVTGNWIENPVGAFASRFDGNTRLRSVWGQDAWAINDRLKSVLGLRVEQWSAYNGLTQSAFTGATSVGNCDAGTDLCTINHDKRSKTWVSPKAALGWQAGEDWVLRGSMGRAVRLPTVAELYQGGVNAQGVTINNNPNLKPERSVTSELSSEWNFAATALRATLFYETTRDALYSLLNTATNQSNIQNVDHVRTRGIETALNAQDVVGVKGVDLQASLTYTDSKVVESSGYVKVPGDVVGKDQIRVPRWRASALASWRVNEKFSTSLGARYGSKQFSTLDNSDPNGFAYTASSKYATADWRARYQFDRRWSAAIGIDNLFGYTYWNFHPYPQRSYNAELKFDL
ncbi:MAG: hypothetical protein RLZZ584_3504 [Pseudomonadota bacterium]|jgi:iron complex outermembrane receptor protein